MKLVDVALDDGSMARGLQGPPPQNPIIVDFQSPKLLHRIKNGVGSELIVRAVGLAPKDRADVLIYDFTAGLGTDSFLLACAGFRVVGFERDAMIFEILQDGLRRLRQAGVQLEFRNEDAVKALGSDFAKSSETKPYAVLIDPMFEEAATSMKSLPKKEMAVLRELLPPSSADELGRLFHTAWSVATSRVIVKRPVGSPEIVDGRTMEGLGRTLSPRRLEGKTARFDIYSCR